MDDLKLKEDEAMNLESTTANDILVFGGGEPPGPLMIGGNK